MRLFGSQMNNESYKHSKSSPIQTLTVGFGIAPNHALARSRTLPPVGTFTLP